jgi:hypothetical protein
MVVVAVVGGGVGEVMVGATVGRWATGVHVVAVE